MTAQDDVIKKHAIARLDREASIHPSNHQAVHARRYLLPRLGGKNAEVVIIVEGSRLQLWCEAAAIDRAVVQPLEGKFRSGSETYARQNAKGETLYGRHSALKTMDNLHRGDAWHIVPKTITDLDRILDAIKV